MDTKKITPLDLFTYQKSYHSRSSGSMIRDILLINPALEAKVIVETWINNSEIVRDNKGGRQFVLNRYWKRISIEKDEAKYKAEREKTIGSTKEEAALTQGENIEAKGIVWTLSMHGNVKELETDLSGKFLSVQDGYKNAPKYFAHLVSEYGSSAFSYSFRLK